MTKMTQKQKAFKLSLVKQVHTAPKYIALFKNDETAYRDKLEAHFGKRSSTELSIDQLIALVRWLRDELPELPMLKDRSEEATLRQTIAIRGLWQRYARDKSDKALRSFVAKITGNTYIHPDKLTKKDAQKVILALKNSLKER